MPITLPMLSSFQHDDWPSYVRVKKSPRAKRLSLRLDTKERVFYLVLPKGVSMGRAKAFADKHDEWMRERLEALPALTPFADEQGFPLLGTWRTIEVTKHDKKRTVIELEDRKLKVLTHLDDPSPRIQRFLKEYAKEIMAPIAQEKALKIDKLISNLQVRDTKSRWGSCSHDGKMSLSWRLILAPHEAMDYVIAHEVAHLRHLDHSKKFWALCEELSDDYEEGRYWMRNHGQELMSYGLIKS